MAAKQSRILNPKPCNSYLNSLIFCLIHLAVDSLTVAATMTMTVIVTVTVMVMVTVTLPRRKPEP